MTVAQALAAAQAAGLARLDAQWLLGHHLGRPRTWLLAHGDEPLPPTLAQGWPTLLARRQAGEPLAYLLGAAEFCGLALAVTPAVLIPRPETEGLVRWAVELLADAPDGPLLDLGTGSGAVALALKATHPQRTVHASDASPAALAVAGHNASRLQLPLALHQGCWWQAVPGLRFALAVSNPPYVAPGDPHLADLAHEPLAALVPADDAGRGLADLQRLVTGASPHLQRGGWLLLEHGHDQGQAVRGLLAAQGFDAIETRADLAGMPRCSGGRRA